MKVVLAGRETKTKTITITDAQANLSMLTQNCGDDDQPF